MIKYITIALLFNCLVAQAQIHAIATLNRHPGGGVVDTIPPVEPPPPDVYDQYVELTGADTTDCSNIAAPCRTLIYALTQSSSGDTTKMGSGTFTEADYIVVPLGRSIRGNGMGNTIIKLPTSLNYEGSFSSSKTMMQFTGGTGNQTLSDISLEGNSKGIHAGIYIGNRNNVDLKNVSVSSFDYFGIYVRGTGMDFTNVTVTNCAFGNSSFSTGALMVDVTTNLICRNVDIAEGEGYGVKAWGSQPIIQGFEFRYGSSITVPPGSACCSNRNIAFELHDCYPRDCLIDSAYIDGNISLVKPQDYADDGEHSITVSHSTIDLLTRGNTNTTGIELTMHGVTINNNYFISAKTAFIMNFDDNLPSRNWLIHSNVFKAINLVQVNPTGVIRSDCGFYNMDVWNNTIDIPPGSNQTLAVLYQGANGNGKTSTDVQFKNNIVLDRSTADGSSGANHLYRIEGSGGSVIGSTISYNIIFGMPTGAVSGVTYSANLAASPELILSGAAPIPYYRPDAGSPAIESGINVGLPFSGSAPTRGALEQN